MKNEPRSPNLDKLSANGIREPLLQKELRNENEAIKKKNESAAQRLGCLKRLYPRDYDLPSNIVKSSLKFKRPDQVDLLFEYCQVTDYLRSIIKECNITGSEGKLFRQLEQYTRKKIHRSIWIGTHCTDLFLPNARSYTKHPDKVMRGLVIEVDGDCHNFEDKMQKDERKGRDLSVIGIGVTHIKNWDFQKPPVQRLKKEFKYLPTLDSRERQRLWQRIYAYTLAIHLSDEKFFKIFRPIKQINGV